MRKIKTVTENIYMQLLIITAAVIWTLQLQTSNIFAVILLVGVYFFLQTKVYEHDRLERRIVSILSIGFSVLWVAGNYEAYQMNCVGKILQYIISVCGLYMLINKILGLLFHKLLAIELYEERKLKIRPWVFAAAVFGVCILCWIPYFLAYYPGIITDDAEWQLAQAIGLRSYSNHQPWIHTMLHRLFYFLGFSLFHTPNAGVAACVIAQMCVMAGSYAYLLMTFYKEKLHKYFIFGCLLFFAVIPFNAVYAVTLWKDVLLGAVVLLFSLSIWKIIRKSEAGKGAGDYVLFGITGVLLCILRSNGYYAYLLCIPFFILFFKRKRKIIIPICITTVMLTVFYKGPVLEYYEVEPPDRIESLSVPAQHIARVIADGGELTREQYELLERAVDVSQIKEVYFPTISDPIKTLVRETGDQEYIEKHKWDYFKLWLELGVRHPSTYLKAQIDQTKGYWYPDVQYWVTTTMLKENDWGMFRDSKLPDSVVKGMEFWENIYIDIPVLGLLWSIGFYTWMLFVLAGVSIKKGKSILPFLPVLTILISLFIATPVQAEFRYSYAMITTMPLFVVIGCSNLQERKNEKNSSVDTML
ncbi:hypothetical protein H8S37_01160 [Mediterraneibacter sp. NSJ-55]|uniref:Uncharacterized protein n=1 Tax=Mediterraneibacter hominis TaxID=2763054 RepID=A0A923LFV5_9FIRM|nr:DUF6020 family protein [Mediterraneibacter hominis]MBC5687544.1 hypothetical protein [Mediterraneibacter hominis]